MNCPLCNKPLRRDGPIIYRVWMEMESNEERIVGVHLSCAWEAVRDTLYERDEGGVSHDFAWVGWEPMEPLGGQSA